MGYVGIDTDQFPGLAQLLAVSKAGVSWCGYYLVAPSHQESGWSGQRAAVEAAGLACVPIYVGQQIVGPGSHRTGPIQGTMDGNDAAAKMQAEGFRPGQVVYLDLENGAPFAAPQTDYVAAWCRQVIAGGFRAGVYCSHKIAEAVSIANPGAIIWAFEVPTLEPSTASPPFAAPDPAGCGFLEACIWQHEDTVTISGEGFHLVVDLDSSIIANPALGSAQPMPLPAAARQGPAPPSPAPRPAPAPLAPPAPDLFIPPPPSPPAAHP
ncbi:MAG TPA: glycoside hydrolase domain-containing protein, partial [Caulobacteraceae bacterium]